MLLGQIQFGHYLFFKDSFEQHIDLFGLTYLQKMDINKLRHFVHPSKPLTCLKYWCVIQEMYLCISEFIP